MTVWPVELGQLLPEKDYSEGGRTGVLGAPPDRALEPDYLPSARYLAREAPWVRSPGTYFPGRG